MIRRLIFRALSVLPFGAGAGALIWTLSLSPFTAPMVERSQESAARAIDRALAQRVTPDWLATEMDAALTAQDWDRVQTLALIGADWGFAPSPEMLARMSTLEAEKTGFAAQAGDCLTCMADVAFCPSLAALASCGVPFELSPLGDVNALRRAAWAAVNGDEIDKLDVTLALAGVAATVAVPLSGGTSYTAKAGATVIRVGRKLGTLTPTFLRLLGDLADVGLKADRLLPYLAGRVPLDDVLDTAKLARLESVGRDMSRVYHNTGSLTDSVVLLKHVDSAEDAATVARASDILGPRTARTFDVLGKGRMFRAMMRLSNLTLTALALVMLMALHICGFLGQLIGQRVILRPMGRWAARQAKS